MLNNTMQYSARGVTHRTADMSSVGSQAMSGGTVRVRFLVSEYTPDERSAPGMSDSACTAMLLAMRMTRTDGVPSAVRSALSVETVTSSPVTPDTHGPCRAAPSAVQGSRVQCRAE